MAGLCIHPRHATQRHTGVPDYDLARSLIDELPVPVLISGGLRSPQAVREAFARRLFRSVRAGLYAALMLLSSFGIFIFTRITIPDAMVCLWLTLALYAFWRTEEDLKDARRWSYVFAIACALNVLTKGLIGLVFPVGIVLLYLLLTRTPRGVLARLRSLYPVTSLLVFLASMLLTGTAVLIRGRAGAKPPPRHASQHFMSVKDAAVSARAVTEAILGDLAKAERGVVVDSPPGVGTTVRACVPF